MTEVDTRCYGYYGRRLRSGYKYVVSALKIEETVRVHSARLQKLLRTVLCASVPRITANRGPNVDRKRKSRCRVFFKFEREKDFGGRTNVEKGKTCVALDYPVNEDRDQ